MLLIRFLTCLLHSLTTVPSPAAATPAPLVQEVGVQPRPDPGGAALGTSMGPCEEPAGDPRWKVDALLPAGELAIVGCAAGGVSRPLLGDFASKGIDFSQNGLGNWTPFCSNTFAHLISASRPLNTAVHSHQFWSMGVCTGTS